MLYCSFPILKVVELPRFTHEHPGSWDDHPPPGGPRRYLPPFIIDATVLLGRNITEALSSDKHNGFSNINSGSSHDGEGEVQCVD